MTNEIHLTKNNHYEYFICNKPDETKNFVKISLDTVALKAFRNSKTIENVQFKSTKTIEESAFEGCTNLKTIICGNLTEEKDKDYPNIVNIALDSVGDKLTVQTKAFMNCENLHTVILPKAEKLYIEKDSFSGCTNLRTIVMLGIEEVYISPEAFMNVLDITFIIDANNTCAAIFAREKNWRYIDV